MNHLSRGWPECKPRSPARSDDAITRRSSYISAETARHSSILRASPTESLLLPETHLGFTYLMPCLQFFCLVPPQRMLSGGPPFLSASSFLLPFRYAMNRMKNNQLEAVSEPLVEALIVHLLSEFARSCAVLCCASRTDDSFRLHGLQHVQDIFCSRSCIDRLVIKKV
jgi:hypothetical protein